MYNISMGKQTFIVVFCTTLILFSMLFLISDLMYMEGYKEFEEQTAKEDMNRVSEALSTQLNTLSTLCYDWAVWDETYEFVQEPNAEYIETNLNSLESFTNIGINILLIVNPLGEVVYSKAFNPETMADLELPEDFTNYFSHGQTTNPSGEHQISGIISIPNSPLLVSSRPILTSKGEGPSTGTIVMGHSLDSSTIESLSDITHLSLNIRPLIYPDFPPELKTAIYSPNGTNPVFIQTLSKNSIAGYLLVEDINGNPAFAFQAEIARTIYAQGQKTLAYLHVSLLFISVVFFFVLIFAVNKTVLTRMTTLSDSVNSIGREGNTSRRISVSGKDELSSLANNINGMLDSLEKSGTALRVQKEFIDRILTNTPNAVLVTNSSQKVMLANSAFNAMFNLGADNLEGKDLASIPTLENLSSEIERFMESKSANDKIEFQYKGSGIKKILAISFTRMEEEMCLIVLTDVTAERERQAQLYLADRLVSIGEMTSGIAHELNNPLTSIIGLSSLLTEENLQEDIKEDLRTVSGEAQRAAGIVQKMLSFARRRESIKQPVQLNKVVEDILAMRAHDLMGKNIEAICNLDPNLPQVVADYFQMQQVFLNIVLNAEQAMSEAHGKGTLKITSEKVNKIIRLSFSDDGPGIEQQNLDHIFDPFFTTKEVGKGTGLGLSICYGIVTAHKGQIYARSEIGKGATFIIEFPDSIAV